jgi:hypothetical protein
MDIFSGICFSIMTERMTDWLEVDKKVSQETPFEWKWTSCCYSIEHIQGELFPASRGIRLEGNTRTV